MIKRVIHDQFGEASHGRQMDMIIQWGSEMVKIRVYKDHDSHRSQFQTWVWQPIDREWHSVVIFQPRRTAGQMPVSHDLADAEAAFRSLAASLLVPTLRVMHKLADIDEYGKEVDKFMVAYDLVCAGVKV